MSWRFFEATILPPKRYSAGGGCSAIFWLGVFIVSLLVFLIFFSSTQNQTIVSILSIIGVAYVIFVMAGLFIGKPVSSEAIGRLVIKENIITVYWNDESKATQEFNIVDIKRFTFYSGGRQHGHPYQRQLIIVEGGITHNFEIEIADLQQTENLNYILKSWKLQGYKAIG